MSRTLNRIGLFTLCAVVTGSLLLPEARILAQGVALEEIVVTARKREEALVDIPFAVSAFSEEELNAANLKNFVDVQLFTPGLTYQQATANRADRGVPNIVIRGLNINAFSGSSVAALFFVDGAPVLGGEVGSFVDVIRVEVLRGPQTAYFGRNTFSGAVNLVTKDPGEEFGGSVGLDLDRFGTADLQLSVEGAHYRGPAGFSPFREEQQEGRPLQEQPQRRKRDRRRGHPVAGCNHSGHAHRYVAVQAQARRYRDQRRAPALLPLSEQFRELRSGR